MSLNPRFFIDDIEIDEPIGWDSLNISIRRDESLHGIGFESTTTELSFYGEAMAYIDCVKLNQGLRSKIVFRAIQNCDGSNEYEEILTGTLNMGKYKKNCGTTCFVTMPVETSSCELTFVNKFDQNVDADSIVGQAGVVALPAYPQLGITIQIPTKDIDYKSIGSIVTPDVEPVTFSSPGGGSEAYALVRPEYIEVNADIQDTHLTGGTDIGYSGPHGIFIPISSQVLMNENNIKCFNVPFHATGRLKGTLLMPGVSNLDVYGVMLEGELDANWPINDPNQHVEQVTLGININTDSSGAFAFDFTMTPFDWVPKNNGADGIYLYLALHQHPGAVFNGTVTFDADTFINISGVKACPPTPVKAYMVHELLSRLTENITDMCMRVKSTYYGREDSQPFGFDLDGCGGLRMVTSGLMVRNAANAKFFISPKTLIEGLQFIDNIGIGFEDDSVRAGNKLLRVEELDFFYQDFEIFQCLGIAQATFEIEEARDYSIVKIGYKKWTTLADFGLDEINSDREYHLDIQTLNQTVDLRSGLVAGQYAWEVTREQQFAESSAADTVYDDEAFIMCLKRLTYNTFQVEQGNITNPQNMFNPPTVFNYRISPLRNLMRWYRSCANAYPVLSDSGNKLFFSSGTGNFIASGQLAEGYGYGTEFCKLEGVDIKENVDLFITMFNDVAKSTPLWRNETITYEYPMSVADYNSIKARRYGYITYQCGDGALMKGWIKDIEYTPARGSAKFTLRQKWDTQTCDLKQFDVPSVTPLPPTPPPPTLGLRLLFDDILNADVLVGDSSNLSDWNTFFDTSIEASTPFTSLDIIGNQVTLIGATNLNIKDNLFLNVTAILSIIDDATVVISVGNSSFLNASALGGANLPACTIIGPDGFRGCTLLIDILGTDPITMNAGAFHDCPDLTPPTFNNLTTMGNYAFLSCSIMNSFSAPLLASIGFGAFQNCPALTNIYIPSCTDLGGDPGDDTVFFGISGNNITLTIPTATATDGDVVYLQANNAVTLILV